MAYGRSVRLNPLYAACIRRAAKVLGGYYPLGAHLGVSAKTLQRWANGDGVCGDAVFLRVVDILHEANARLTPPGKAIGATSEDAGKGRSVRT